ncbi:MAG: MMPL family transporter [Clostridia bacterium]|nr:MMPL family transporter [Clostridia bacterium]
MNGQKNVSGALERFTSALASYIIKYRFVIFALFAAAAVYCALSVGKVRVNNELTAFLPAESETRRGIAVMNEEFTTYASASVMLENVSAEEAKITADEIAALPRVAEAAFDETPAHYRENCALINVSFDCAESAPAVSETMDDIKQIAGKYKYYTASSFLHNYGKQLADEMGVVMLIAVLVILAVLLFTSRSYFEVVIFAVVFVFAALLNLGTNYWLGEISTITNTVAVILQLALAIDYAIIFAHRYQDELAGSENERDALTRSLARSMVEISSSSLTTISGLAALTLMQFRLGYDLGTVLAKGIVCSMLTVFLLMPGLISLFPKVLKKTSHRKLLPNIEKWGKILMNSKNAFVIVFALLLPFAVYFSKNAVYAFSDSSVSEIVESERRTAMHRINDVFSSNTSIAVIVPNGDYKKESRVLEAVSALDGVKSTMGISSIEFAPGKYLTDEYGGAEFGEMLGIPAEYAALLFTSYATSKGDYPALNDPEYKVPLIDIASYLFDIIDNGLVNLSEEQKETLAEVRPQLQRATDQLCGTKHDRLVIASSYAIESEEATALVESIRAAAAKEYPADEIIIAGDVTSARDLRESYQGDSLLINILTIVFVFLILIFTFRSFVGAAILVFVIQGSIWINFSFPYLFGSRPSFVTDMIVSAIQMGATIDYAIVLYSRYTALRKQYEKKRAMALAVNECFPTVITSGTIMAAAGLLIAYRISDVYVGHIGLAVGRGAIISVILVLTVLPQLLVLLDKAIEKTTFRLGSRKSK